MNASILTSRQTDELYGFRRAVLDYLNANNFRASFDTFRQEAKLDDYNVEDGSAKNAQILEKKWTSVVRLQRKIIELESKITQLQDELAAGPIRSNGKSNSDMLPRAPERHLLSGHRHPITSVAFHPSFAVLASASEDATIKLWDYESGEFERTVKGHTKAVNCVTFDERGAVMASCSADLSIKVWDVQNDYRNVRTLHGHDHSVSYVAFVPGSNGNMLASVSRDKTIKIWDLTSGYCVKTWTGHLEWVRFIDFSEDGTLLATCSNDQTARVWNYASGDTRVELRGHDHVVECVRFVPTSTYPLIRELCNISEPKTVGTAASASANAPGQYVITGCRDKTIKLWDANGQCIYTFTGHDNWVRGLEFHPSGKYVLSVSDDKSIKVWDLRTGRCVKTLQDAHDHFVTCIAWCPITPALATGSVETNVKIWECK
ncbi:Lissencephaly-1 [Sorochytrium milnesiophthora]